MAGLAPRSLRSRLSAKTERRALASANEAAGLAGLKAERASVAAQGRRIETETAPVAELIGTGADSEQPSGG